MTHQQPPLEPSDLPTLKAERRRKAQTATRETEKPEKSRSALWPAITVLIFCITGVAYWNHMLANQLHSQKQQNQAALERITELENRLSSTDENMSQSSISLQVRIRELNQRTDDLWTQMDKLWASAWRRNQKDLADHGRALEKIQAEDQQQNLKFKDLQADLATITARLDEMDQISNDLAATQKSLVSLKQSINQTATSLKKMQTSIDDNTGWVESSISFRKQINQQFDRLDKRLKRVEPPVIR